MPEWFAAKSLLGAPRWLLVLLAGAALAGAVGFLVTSVNRHDAVQREAGAAEQRAGDLGETVKRVETANEVRDQIRAPGSRALYDECVRSARVPAYCERFLPEHPDHHGRPGTGR